MLRAILLLSSLTAISIASAAQISELSSFTIAVAIRYLQPTGVSHAHIYLYSGDGKLVRRLTTDNSGQDCDPIFAKDGRQIVFTRRKSKSNETWSVQPDGHGLHRLVSAPRWYKDALAEPVQRFDYPPNAPLPHNPTERGAADTIRPGEVRYAAPDQSVELILRDDPHNPDPAEDWYPKIPYLHDTNDGSEVAIPSFPIIKLAQTGALAEKQTGQDSFCPSDDEPFKLDSVLVRDGSPFYFQGPFRLAFFRQHHDSTCGESWFVLDLKQRRLVELFPNDGDVIIIPNAPAFFCVCQERYLPLGDGQHTVNCSYLDLWNAELTRTRFSEPKVARFYGASVYDSARHQRLAVVSPERLTE
jgi:hypothetical protein